MNGISLDQPWVPMLSPDLLALAFSALMIGAYYCYLRIRVRRDPTYSIHFVNESARRLWVQHVMINPARDVMAVQTLRNFIAERSPRRKRSVGAGSRRRPPQ